MLWDATVKNIRSGQDVFSPLVQPLPRTYAQDDPELINIIRQKYLVPPSEEAYNIKAKEDTSMGQAQTVRQILNNKVKLHIHAYYTIHTYTLIIEPNSQHFLVAPL